jgi:hypothetical protein
LVILVVEDDRHSMLIRRYLINCGLRKHEIRIEQSPSGRGSAESWVRKAFVKNVSAYRVRQAKANSALIAVIDADIHTVQERLRQLDQALTDESKSAISDGEQIARLVPKRNLETWILCLNQHTVDEESDYKQTRNDWEDLIPTAASALAQWSRQLPQLPDNCIASLRSGVGELKNLRLRE